MSLGSNNTQQARDASQQIDRDHLNELNSLKQRHTQEIQQLEEAKRRTKQQVGDAYLNNMMVKKREHQDTRAALAHEENNISQTSQQLNAFESDLKHKKNELSSQHKQIEHYMSKLESTYKDKEKSIEKLREHIEKQKSIIRTSEETKRNALARIEESKLAIHSENAKSMTAEEQLKTTNHDLDSVTKQLADNEAIMVETQTQINKLKNDLKITKSREHAVEKDINKIASDIDKAHKDIDQYNETMAKNEQSVVAAESQLAIARSANEGTRDEKRARVDQAGERVRQLHEQSTAVHNRILAINEELNKYMNAGSRSHQTLRQMQEASATVNKSLSVATNAYDEYVGVRDSLASQKSSLSTEARALREGKDMNVRVAQGQIRNINEWKSDMHVLNNAAVNAHNEINRSNEDEVMYHREMSDIDLKRSEVRMQTDDVNNGINIVNSELSRHRSALSKHEEEKVDFKRVCDDHTMYEKAHNDEMLAVQREFGY
jgi:chromosome segregation ATPase